MKKRVIILVSHPIQYFVPVYKELAQNYDLDVLVLFHTRVGLDSYHDVGFGCEVKWDFDLLDGYNHKFLSTSHSFRGVKYKIFGELFIFRPDVIILHGYNHPTNMVAWFVAILLGVKVIIRGDTRVSPRHKVLSFGNILKRIIFKFASGFISIGSLNEEFYNFFGAASDKIFRAPFCVDNRKFESSREKKYALRKKYNFHENKKIILFVAKLVPQKRPKDIILAVKKILSKIDDPLVVYVGSGEQESELNFLSKEMGVSAVFAGFVNQSRLPDFYAIADVFVLPSGAESWGLVVNEAMAAGLPIVVTDDVGAYADLVANKGTGIVYPVGDVDALSDALFNILSNDDLRDSMGKKSAELIADWSIAKSASGIYQAVNALMAK